MLTRVGFASPLTRASSTIHLRSVASLVDFGNRHVTKGLPKLINGVVKSGKGSYIQMEDGRQLLDFSCGIGVVNLGHCHPKVTQAAIDQCKQISHAQCGIAYHRPYLRLIEKLIQIMPDKSLDTFFLTNTGSEAVEGAIKLARISTGRQNIITMQGGFHGRTFGTMALTTSKTMYSEGVLPGMPGVRPVPFPYWHQLGLPVTTSEDDLSKAALYHLGLCLKQQTAPRDTAAILLEPVLGEGGYVPAPPTFFKGLRKICDEHGILLIIDEVQSGFGRTGKYFSTEYSGVKPDVFVIAKGIANGFPLSAVITRKEISDTLTPGSFGGTYAGNAVSCAAGVAVAEALAEEKILDNVQARSKELFSYLNKLREDPIVGPNVLDIRGQGLMVGFEFASPSGAEHDPFLKPGAPKSMASRVANKCLEKGMVILTTSAFEVVRFIPPLNITQGDLKKGYDIFAEAVKEVVREG